MKYCVYLTKYNGTKLPKYYVGSSSVKRVTKGYRGSVKSKKFKEIWTKELYENFNLFDTKIISYHNTREEALQNELKYQMEHDVVSSLEYINESLATPNGFFGRDVFGKNNPMYRRNHTEETKKLISKNHHNVKGSLNPWYKNPTNGFKGKKHTEKSKLKMSLAERNISGQNNPMYGLKGENHPAYGNKHTEETKLKLKYLKPKIICPHCHKEGGKPVMIRFHFDKCKLKG